jgi:uncharacterized protein Usg
MGDSGLYLRGYDLTTIHIYYYMPDYRSVINEFVWQTMDVKPTFPRIHKFLNHWHTNIDAPIKEILLSHGTWCKEFKNVNHILEV